MAVAGLQKASVLDSYLGENHSPESRRWSNKERSTTRTSSIRKMWKDLESEGRLVENGRQQMRGVLTGNKGSCSSSFEGESTESEDTSMDANEVENECPQNRNQTGLQNGQDDDNILSLQCSPSFAVPEKDCVRKIFHELGSKSFGGHTPYSSCMNNYSRERCLGENEIKRVRIVREWIESNTQQGNSHRTGIQDPATAIGSQIERVRDGLEDCGVGPQSSIRRIYGRQALLDLLTKFRRERERELAALLESRFVSNFAHRHRIQSLLKGRFLRNRRFVEDDKQTSVAASELGLLRQTNAVSDIRKGFLSRLNNYDHAPEGVQSETLSDNDMKYDCVEQVEQIVQEIPFEIGEEFETTILASELEANSPQEFASPVVETHDKVLQDEEREKLPLTVEFTGTRIQYKDDSVEKKQDVYHIELSQGTMGTECRAEGPLPDVDEVMLGPHMSNTEELEMHDASGCLHPLQTSTDSFNWQEVSTQPEEWQESVTEDDDGGWHHLTHIESDESIDVNSNENEHGWYQETAGSDFEESHEEWYDNVLEDATESWVGGNSYREAVAVGRSDAFYSSSDDNGSRLELRELTSRRRVSNLLQSDFGVRLEQLMQSYVDRQDQALESENEWMLDREQEYQEQRSVHENAGGIGIEAVERTEGAYPSSSVIPHTQGDSDLQGAADSQFPNIHQHLGTEREIINGLRIDMDMLQQRMDDMQRMLEACMDMQLELQRSVQQEVYSALNRSSNSDGIRNYGSESSPGKEGGVCVLCCDNGFDSLPDRSANMYICSKCAKKINWSKIKESVMHL